MSYKVGDKVVYEVKSVIRDNVYLLSGWKESEPLSTYTRPLEAKIRRQAAEITRLLAENKELKEDFEKSKRVNLNMGRVAGQNEAWELARKGMLMSSTDREAIFGSGFNAMYGVLTYFDYKHAAAKVAEWEKAKGEIKVGDIVRIHEGNNNDLCVLCMSTDKKYYNAVDGYGAVYYMLTKEMITPTGRHIDIDGFLKQIGGEQE